MVSWEEKACVPGAGLAVSWGFEGVLLFWYSRNQEGCSHTAGKLCISLPLLIAEPGRSGTKGALFGIGAESVSLAPGVSWTLLPSCLAEAASSSWQCALLELDLTWVRRRCVRRWVLSANTKRGRIGFLEGGRSLALGT